MKQTLFPEIPTREQVAKYHSIFVILDGYGKGTASMEQVQAIAKDELEAARDWRSSVSFALLKADIPEFWDDDEQ